MVLTPCNCLPSFPLEVGKSSIWSSLPLFGSNDRNVILVLKNLITGGRGRGENSRRFVADRSK